MSIILMLLNPVIGAMFYIANILRNEYNRMNISLLVLFLALINITIKGSETDYSWYMPLYSDALKTNLSDYLFSLNRSKEPLYTFANYILANIFFGNRILFSIFSTSFFYFGIIKGLYSIQRIFQIKKIYLATSVIFLIFFPYIFANTANVLRQYYATSMLLWAIPEILVGNKKFWILAIASIFVHTSSGLIVLLLAIPLLKKRITLINSLYYIAAYLMLKYLSSIADLLNSIIGNSFLSYALMKASTKTTFETVFTFEKIVFVSFTTIVPLLLVNICSSLRKNDLLIRFVNIQFFLYLFLMANLDQAELCVRMNMYLWCFLPFNLLILISYFKISKLTCYILSYAVFFFFLTYQLMLTKNTYYCNDSLLYSSFFSYFVDSKLYLLR